MIAKRLGHLPVLKPWLPVAILVVTGALALRNLVGVVHFALHRAFEGDFAVYYIFARVGIDHGWGSLYDYAAMRQEWLALGSAFLYPALYPPTLAWFVTPFAALPFAAGYALWNVVLVASLLVTWWLTAPLSSRVVRFGLERPFVRGVSFQLATYCGRHLDPGDLENRATMPDVVKGIVEQTQGMVAEGDFYPLPCAHPNCHMMCYLYRGGPKPVSISRIIDVEKHMDLIANSVIYTPARARLLVQKYLEGAGDCGCGPGGCGTADPNLDEFVVKALAEKLNGSDVFRIDTTSRL